MKLHSSLAAALIASLASQAYADDAVPVPTVPNPTVPNPTVPTVPVTAPALSVTLEKGAAVLHRGEQRTVVVPTAVEAVHLVGSKLYVSLGTAGVALYDVTEPSSPKLVTTTHEVEGRVIGFHDVGDETWMEIVARRSIPAPSGNPGSSSPTAPPAVPSAKTSAPPQAAIVVNKKPMTVLQNASGEVEVSGGKAEGIAVGQRLNVYRMESVSDVRSDYVNRGRVAVVVVLSVREHSCLAMLGRGDRVLVGDSVESGGTDDFESVIFPAPLVRLIDFSATLRPVVNVGTPLGGGVLLDAAATYLGKGYFAGVRVHPLGIGATKGGAIVSTSVLAEGGYDARPFALGLGIGVSAVNGNIDSLLGYGQPDQTFQAGTGTTTTVRNTNTAVALSQTVRLGARDGLNFALVNVFIYHERATGETGFIYGATTAKLSVPLMQSTDLFAEGGGGIMGYAFGALGVHTWLVGRGDAGSLAVSVAAGGASVWGSQTVEVTVPGNTVFTSESRFGIAGPMASLGLQYRMGL